VELDRVSRQGEGGRVVRAAVVQDASVAFDRERTLDKVADLAAKAAAEGARLVVFPEAFVAGYPKLADFGVTVGRRSPEGREWFRRYYDSSVEVPGPSVNLLRDIARTHAIHLVMPVIERSGGTLYCTVLYIGPAGELLGTHRKLVPTAAERLIWGEGDGSTITVVPTALGRLGGAICWENYMPQLRLALYGQGIELYCIPTADSREWWLSSMRHIALEGRCFVLSACQYARRSDYPSDYPIDVTDPDVVLMEGGSCIIDPLGRVLAGPLIGQTGVLVADLDMDEIVRGKFDLDVVGHYARPDIFRLLVDRTARHVALDDRSPNPAEPVD
jgi:nitrilase